MEIEKEVLAVLKDCTFNESGTRLYINSGTLSPELYKRVNTVLTRLRGKYKTNRRYHEFPFDARPFFQETLATGLYPPDNPTAYYFTEKHVVADILANVYIADWPEFRILEPSAGTGHMADVIKHVAPTATLDLVEMLDFNIALLEQKGYIVHAGDFLEFNADSLYDLVVMNPPFSVEGNTTAYVDHVQRAFNFLKPKGQLAAILPMGWTFSTQKKLTEFRNFIWQHIECGWELPKDTFKSSGTTVATCVVVLTKQNWKTQPHNGFNSWNGANAQLYICNDSESLAKAIEYAKMGVKPFGRFLQNFVESTNVAHFEGITLTDEDIAELHEYFLEY